MRISDNMYHIYLSGDEVRRLSSLLVSLQHTSSYKNFEPDVIHFCDDLVFDIGDLLRGPDIPGFIRNCYRAEASRSENDFFTFYKGVIAAAYELGFCSDCLNDLYEARQEFFYECFADDEKTNLS